LIERNKQILGRYDLNMIIFEIYNLWKYATS